MARPSTISSWLGLSASLSTRGATRAASRLCRRIRVAVVLLISVLMLLAGDSKPSASSLGRGRPINSRAAGGSRCSRERPGPGGSGDAALHQGLLGLSLLDVLEELALTWTVKHYVRFINILLSFRLISKAKTIVIYCLSRFNHG